MPVQTIRFAPLPDEEPPPRRGRAARRRVIFLSWVLIWFGAIFCANRHPTARTAGALLWGAGAAIQLVIGGQWLADRGSRGGRIPLST